MNPPMYPEVAVIKGRHEKKKIFGGKTESYFTCEKKMC